MTSSTITPQHFFFYKYQYKKYPKRVTITKPKNKTHQWRNIPFEYQISPVLRWLMYFYEICPTPNLQEIDPGRTALDASCSDPQSSIILLTMICEVFWSHCKNFHYLNLKTTKLNLYNRCNGWVKGTELLACPSPFSVSCWIRNIVLIWYFLDFYSDLQDIPSIGLKNVIRVETLNKGIDAPGALQFELRPSVSTS